MSTRPTVVLSAYNVANSPEVGGHFWVYLQYVLGLRALGCEVYWLEWFTKRSPERDAQAMAKFFERMRIFGLEDQVVLFVAPEKRAKASECTLRGMDASEVEDVFARADLLLNFYYAIDPKLLARFRRTALVDIDPGLLQHWMHEGQIEAAEHDLWFTTGETIGLPGSFIPEAGKRWHRIRPCVSLEEWPVTPSSDSGSMNTVSSWQSCEWVRAGSQYYENNKRVSFLQYRELPKRVSERLELALFFHPERDREELDAMREAGWIIRHSREVAGSPEAYRAYVQGARAEFSCAKPSCMEFRNAWVSDRTLCYLSSGKPAIVQHTGPSAYLPNGEGLFRFSTLEEAGSAIDAVHSDYDRHCRAARALAEEHFDAKKVARRILEIAVT